MKVGTSYDVKGKTVIVTGATAGIGREVAKSLAGQGAEVLLACRNVRAAAETAEWIRAAHPGSTVTVGPRLDLGSPDSIRQFGKELKHEKVHVLINNAGTNFLPVCYTSQRVAAITQVNYLGPYLLTRVLEPRLASAAPARVVNVSSVMHRFAAMPAPLSAFFDAMRKGAADYSNTKLANVLFAQAYDARARKHGITACAVDPGAVNSSIWMKSGLFGKPPGKWLIDFAYATPQDSANTVVSAVTAPWENLKETGKENERDVRFFARGMFAQPWLTGFNGQRSGALSSVATAVVSVGALVGSVTDAPMRTLSGGRLCGQTEAVSAAPAARDLSLAEELWRMSADICGVPEDVQP